jgi:hypothetical protein
MFAHRLLGVTGMAANKQQSYLNPVFRVFREPLIELPQIKSNPETPKKVSMPQINGNRKPPDYQDGKARTKGLFASH